METVEQNIKCIYVTVDLSKFGGDDHMILSVYTVSTFSQYSEQNRMQNLLDTFLLLTTSLCKWWDPTAMLKTLLKNSACLFGNEMNESNVTWSQ